MRVGLYVRVSTEEQKLHGLSIEAQTAALNEWAKTERVKTVDRYIDAGLSARKPATKRPELQRLLRDVEAGRVDLVVFTKLDRWFRNVGEYYKVQEVLEKHNVNWKTIHEDYDTLTAAGRLKINIMLAVAQDEADRTSERIKAVFDRKKQRLEPISGKLTPGYMLVDKKLVIDSEKADMIKDLFRAYLAFRSVCATQKYMRATYNTGYGITSIQRLLSNRRFIGEVYGIKDFCEPIIDENTFNHVQEVLSQRSQRTVRTDRIYLFSGLTYCAKCGHPATVAYNNGRFYYRCSRKWTVGDCDFNGYTREEKIEQYLTENILKKCAEYNIMATKAASGRIRVDEAGIKRKMAKLKDLYLSDLILREEYERDYLPLKAALDDARSVIDAEPKLIDLETMRNALDAYNGFDKSKKKEFWSRTLKDIIVNPDGTFSFSLYDT